MRLIDAIKLNERLGYLQRNYTLVAGYREAMFDAMGEVVDAPTIDAVPVVRCVDCKYRCTYKCPMYHTETCLDDLDGFDDYNVDRTDDDGFCHLGARMDGEENDA